MENRKITYDVMIPVAKKDVNFVHWVVEYIRDYFKSAQCIYIITNSSLFSRLQKVADNYHCLLIDENKMLEGLSYVEVRRILVEKNQRPETTGYYFQQLLKMGFALTEYASGYYLSWDSDTIPLSEIDFFRDGHPLFAKKRECHERYFETMKQMLGLDRQIDGSFIAEHMMFSTIIMKEMIEAINKNDLAKPWWCALLECIDNTKKDENIFSEFEMYGNFCMVNYPKVYEFRELKTFRHAGIIRGRWISKRLLRKLAYDLDLVTFEIYDNPFSVYKYRKAINQYCRILLNNKVSEWIKITRMILKGESLSKFYVGKNEIIH